LHFDKKITLLKELEKYENSSIIRDITYNEIITSILTINYNQLLDMLVMDLFPEVKITDSTIKSAE
jgi:hypothetical protein